MKSGLAFGRFELALDFSDPRERRSFLAPLDGSLHLFLTPLEHRLNPAVGQIADPAGQAEGFSAPPRLVAKEDPLHLARYEHPSPDGGLHQQARILLGGVGPSIGAERPEFNRMIRPLV